ncbi:MAG: hypothetical protein ACTSYB_18365 [Candidatus Helarchaeota archaeon]
MIHHVWLINRAGICLLDRNYTGLEINKQLFTGFLTALSYLANQFNRKLDSLNMGGDMTIYYELEDNLIIAIAVDRDDDEKEIRRKIQNIKDEFKLKYASYLENWDGNIGLFDPFLKDIDRILMLDWNFEYNMKIKSGKATLDYPKKTKVHLSQRGMDLFEAIRAKTVKSKD